MFLTTGRAFVHYHSGTMTRVSPTLHREMGTGYVEISPTDAKNLGIKNGERIKVSSRRGEIQIKAKISRKVNRGVVFIPFHFAEAAANMLTNPAYDPTAKIPEYKACAVKVEKLAA
jgi:predicted molibdopterin-dependent oxidoreductase YjgC